MELNEEIKKIREDIVDKTNNWVYGLLDIICILLILLPLYGEETTLLLKCDMQMVYKIIYIVALGCMSTIGLVEIIFSFINCRRTRIIFNIISLCIQTIAILVCILSMQPYLVATVFILFIIKISVILKEIFYLKKF